LSTAIYDGAMSRYWINDVIICHGSNCHRSLASADTVPMSKAGRTNKSEEMIYNPKVARREITISRKMWFVKISPKLRGLCASCWRRLNPLKARKNAEN
jgi:hypothetical protein